MKKHEYRINKLRKILGLTQAEFAKKIGVTTSRVSRRAKDGNLSNSSIKKICSIFCVSVEWLVDGKGKPFVASIISIEAIGLKWREQNGF